MRFKKTVPIIIIVMGLIISILILTSADKKEGQGVLVSSPEEKSDARFDFGSGNISDSLLKNAGEDKNNSLEDSDYNENLTDFFAEEYSRKVFERSGNFQNAESLEPPSQEEIDNIKKDLVNKIEKIFEGSSFTEKDIIISKDVSLEKQIAYLESVEEITSKHFKNFDKGIFEVIEEWVGSRGEIDSGLKKYSEIASKQLNDFLELEVPASWKDFHLKNLNLWSKKKQLLSAFINTENDALKSIIAFQKISELEEYNQALSDSFIKNYRELVETYNK